MTAGRSEQVAVDAAWVRQVRTQLRYLADVMASNADDFNKVDEAMAVLEELGFEIKP